MQYKSGCVAPLLYCIAPPQRVVCFLYVFVLYSCVCVCYVCFYCIY